MLPKYTVFFRRVYKFFNKKTLKMLLSENMLFISNFWTVLFSTRRK